MVFVSSAGSESFAKRFHPRCNRASSSEGNEGNVSPIRLSPRALVLDGTPIRLCSRSDIGSEAEDAVRVAAIDAGQLLHSSQIAQFAPIDAHLLSPARTL
jgi:hypothetical protein